VPPYLPATLTTLQAVRAEEGGAAGDLHRRIHRAKNAPRNERAVDHRLVRRRSARLGATAEGDPVRVRDTRRLEPVLHLAHCLQQVLVRPALAHER
jgi:hypothetical protein